MVEAYASKLKIPDHYPWVITLQMGGSVRCNCLGQFICKRLGQFLANGWVNSAAIGHFVISGEHCGCEELLKVVQKIQPKIHVFGHLHHGYGQVTLDKTLFVNASNCTEEYRPTNSPIIIVDNFGTGTKTCL